MNAAAFIRAGRGLAALGCLVLGGALGILLAGAARAASPSDSSASSVTLQGATDAQLEAELKRRRAAKRAARKAPRGTPSLADAMAAAAGGVPQPNSDQLLDSAAKAKRDAETAARRERAPTLDNLRRKPWDHVLLRQNYSDVLTLEDTSVPEGKSGDSFDSLKGALFSYTRNGRKDSDAWLVQAAVILPIVFPHPPADANGKLGYGAPPGGGIYSWGMAPSVTLNRAKDSKDASADVDSLIYRLGFFATLMSPSETPEGKVPATYTKLNLRGSFTYATDTSHRQSIPAGEFDLEPQIWFRGSPLAIGVYRRDPFWPDEPGKATETKHFAYQWRVWLHAEGGQVQDTGGPGNSIRKGSFARVGPATRFDLEFPIFKGLKLGAEYAYHAAITGSASHLGLFRANADYILFKDERGRSVSLKASYVNGGIEISKKSTRLLSLGLGIVY